MNKSHQQNCFDPEIYEIDEDNQQSSSNKQHFSQQNYPKQCQSFRNVQDQPNKDDAKATGIEKQENDGIKWNYNAMYPKSQELKFHCEEGQFEQSFMEKHQHVLHRSLEDFCEKYHPLKFYSSLEDVFSAISIRNTDTQVISEIQYCQTLQAEEKVQIQDILYLDPDCYKIIDSALIITPSNLKQFVLYLCVHLIIQGKKLQNVQNNCELKVEINSKIQKLSKNYFQKVLEEFESEDEEHMFEDFCALLDRWMYTIFLAVKGIFQNQIFEEIVESQGRQKSLSSALDEVEKKTQKQRWKKRKNGGNRLKKGKKKFIFKTRYKK